MHVRDLVDVDAFRSLALPFLVRHEAQHCLLLGNLGNPAVRGCVALDGTAVVAAATHLPKRSVCLSVGPMEAAGVLARHTVGWAEVTGAVGPTDGVREYCV